MKKVKRFDPKTMLKGKILKNNPAITPHDPIVGSKVCMGCLGEQVTGPSKPQYDHKGRLAPFPHTFAEGICQFKSPGVPWKIKLEPGEEEFLARQKKLDRIVPF